MTSYINVDVIRNRFPDTKIIVSEIPPRTDDRDEEVKKCNVLINEFVGAWDFLYVVNHAKLRTPDGRNYRDAKHITTYAAPLFVSNLKRPMRTVLGRAKHRFSYPTYSDRGSGRGRGGGRGGGRGRGRGHDGRGRGGRGSWGRDRGNHNQGGGARFNIRDEFEKFKMELMDIVNNR